MLSYINLILIILLTIALVISLVLIKRKYEKDIKEQDETLLKLFGQLNVNDEYLKEKDLENKNEIQELITQNTNDLGETKGYVTDNTALIDENKGLIDENKGLIDGNKVLIDENKVLIDGNKVLIDENKGLIDSNIGLIGDLTNIQSVDPFTVENGYSTSANLQTEIQKKINQMNEKKTTPPQSVPVNHIYEMKGDGYCRSGYIQPPSNDRYHNNGLTKNQCFSKCSQNNKCEYMAYADGGKICALYDSRAGECSNRQRNNAWARNHKTYKKIK